MRSGSEGPDEETMRTLAGLPHADEWPDIDDAERRRRERVLWDVALRVMEDGPHKAKPSPERGRQFMPFAALRGYDEMIAEVERRGSLSPDGDGGCGTGSPTAYGNFVAGQDATSPHIATS